MKTETSIISLFNARTAFSHKQKRSTTRLTLFSWRGDRRFLSSAGAVFRGLLALLLLFILPLLGFIMGTQDGHPFFGFAIGMCVYLALWTISLTPDFFLFLLRSWRGKFPTCPNGKCNGSDYTWDRFSKEGNIYHCKCGQEYLSIHYYCNGLFYGTIFKGTLLIIQSDGSTQEYASHSYFGPWKKAQASIPMEGQDLREKGP